MIAKSLKINSIIENSEIVPDPLAAVDIYKFILTVIAELLHCNTLTYSALDKSKCLKLAVHTRRFLDRLMHFFLVSRGSATNY